MHFAANGSLAFSDIPGIYNRQAGTLPLCSLDFQVSQFWGSFYPQTVYYVQLCNGKLFVEESFRESYGRFVKTTPTTQKLSCNNSAVVGFDLMQPVQNTSTRVFGFPVKFEAAGIYAIARIAPGKKWMRLLARSKFPKIVIHFSRF